MGVPEVPGDEDWPGHIWDMQMDFENSAARHLDKLSTGRGG